VNAPPIIGPVTLEIMKTIPMKLWYSGLFRNGIVFTVKTIVPDMMPAEPRPAIARPTMNVEEFCETPQTKEPSSKIVTLARNTHFGV
jgi:hypothetical protein